MPPAMVEIQMLALEVSVGSTLTKGRDGADDEPGVPLREDVEAQPEGVQLAWSAVLDQDVGFVRERPELDSVRLDIEIEYLGTLARIEIKKECTAFGMGSIVGEGTTLARRVSTRALDLDDVGAEVGEQFGAVGCGHVFGEFEYAQAREGAGGAERGLFGSRFGFRHRGRVAETPRLVDEEF